jgi:hypothetical protein
VHRPQLDNCDEAGTLHSERTDQYFVSGPEIHLSLSLIMTLDSLVDFYQTAHSVAVKSTPTADEAGQMRTCAISSIKLSMEPGGEKHCMCGTDG